MAKIEEAQEVLKALGLPPSQQNEMSALTLLALCGLRPQDGWEQARRAGLTMSKGIMAFVAREYGRHYVVTIYPPSAEKWEVAEVVDRLLKQVQRAGFEVSIVTYEQLAPA